MVPTKRKETVEDEEVFTFTPSEKYEDHSPDHWKRTRVDYPRKTSPSYESVELADRAISAARERFDAAARALEDAQRARVLLAIAKREQTQAAFEEAENARQEAVKASMDSWHE